MTAPELVAPGGVPVAWGRRPFGADVYRDLRPAGQSIAEIVASVPGLPDRFREHGVVCVNGEPVPRPMWARVRPRADGPVPVAVTLHLPLAGGGGGGSRSGGGRGGGGGKNTFGLVASIALLAVTTAITAGAFGPAGLAVAGGLFAKGSTSALLLAGSVGLAGGLAIAALSPPPVSGGSAAATGGGGGDSRELGSASAQGNLIQRGGTIPRVIGTHRVFPPFACEPLVEMVGETEVVEAVFALAGPHELTDIRVDGTPIENIEGLEYETREGWDNDSALTLITRYGITDPAASFELSKHRDDRASDDAVGITTPVADNIPRWHPLVTSREPDEIWLHLLFGEGLTVITEATPTAQLLPMRFRIRKRGESTWINLPEIHWSWTGSQQFRKAVKIIWGTMVSPVPDPPSNYGPVYAFKSVPTRTVSDDTTTGEVGTTGGWTAHSHFSAGSGNNVLLRGNTGTTNVRNVALYDDRVEFYLSETTFPKGVYEVEIIRAQLIAKATLTTSTYGYSTTIYDFFGYFYNNNQAETIHAQKDRRDRVALVRFTSVHNEHPIGGDDGFRGLCLIAAKAKNRALSKVSALASGYVRDWNGTSWTSWLTTSCPAPHFRDVLVGDQNIDPLPTALLDNDSLTEWRTHCLDEGYHCNMIVDGRSVDETLTLIAGCGYARPWRSERWGVILDKDRSAESPVQVFSPRNLRNFRFEKSFARLPDGFRVRYRDEDDDFEETEIIVPAEGYTFETVERLEDVAYEGLTTEAAAKARGEFDLAQARSRSTFYYAEADAESLVCKRGDLVGVQHDILASVGGYARVKSKVLDGNGNVAGLNLDSTIPAETQGVAIRQTDGTITLCPIVQLTEDSDAVTLTTPIADPGDSLDAGCLVVSGLLGSEYRRLIVADVRPGPDLTASLTFLDEAPLLWRDGTTYSGAGAATIAITATAIPSGDANADGAATIAITATASATAAKLATGSADLAITATAAAKATVKAAGTAAIALTGTGAAGASRPMTGSASLAITGTGSALAGRFASGSATLAITGTATPKATLKASAAASLAITGTAAATANVKAAASAALAITGTGAATRTQFASGTAALAITGTGAALRVQLASGTSAIAITAACAATATLKAQGNATLAITGTATAARGFDSGFDSGFG